MTLSSNRFPPSSRSATAQVSELKKAVVVKAFEDDPDGLIPTKYLYDPIEVQLTQIWAFPADTGEVDYVHFSIKPHTPESPYPLPPIPLPGPLTQEKDFPVSLFIKGNWLNISGSYDISYYIDGPGGIEHSPYTTTFTIDRIAPGGNQPLGPGEFVDPDVRTYGITEEYLSDPDHLTVDFKIPSYLDRKAFDAVLIFLLNDESANPYEAAYEHTFPSAVSDLVVPIPGDKFRTLLNGPRIVRYTLRDRAGNQRVDASGPTPVYINLKPSPSGLKPPRVLAFDFDGLIDRKDARAGVTVRFEAYFDWDPTDEVVTLWNGIPLSREPVEGFPKIVSISWPVLIQKGYVQTRMPVQYEIYRAGKPDGVLSPIQHVDCDFRVAGQDHDQAPAEYNRHLERVEIRGQGSNTPNHLDIRDADQPVTASVLLFDGPHAGEQMFLYWGDREDPIASYTVQPTDFAGRRVTFSPIAWSVVEQTPNNPAFPVRYRTSNGVNEQLAPDQAVNINVTAPVNFPQAEFVHVNSFGWLNCQTVPPLWDGVHVRVFKHAAIEINDEIRMHWQGTSGFAGSGPIKETEGLFSQSWNGDDERLGYHDFVVDYRPYVEPIKNPTGEGAGAYAEFTVWRLGMRVGTSRIRYVKIDRLFAHTPPIYCGPNGNGPESDR